MARVHMTFPATWIPPHFRTFVREKFFIGLLKGMCSMGRTVMKGFIFALLVSFLTSMPVYGQSSSDGIELQIRVVQDYARPVRTRFVPFKLSRRVTVTDRSVRLLSEWGEFSLQRPEGLVGAFPAVSGDAVAVVSAARGHASGMGRMVQISAYDWRGRKILEILREYGYDDPIPAILFLGKDLGLVLADPAVAKLFFYSPAGTLAKSETLLPEVSYDLERKVLLAADTSGQVIAVLFNRQGAMPVDVSAGKEEAATTFLHVYSRDGTLLWRRQVDRPDPKALIVSPSGRFLAVSALGVMAEGRVFPQALLFGRNGQVRFKGDFGFQLAAFAQGENRVFLADRSMVRLVDVTKGRLVWEKGLETRRLRLVHIGAAGPYLFLLSAIAGYSEEAKAFVFNEPVLRIMNHRGDLLLSRAFADRSLFQPELAVDAEGLRLLLGFSDAAVEIGVVK
jgi:hypothetical protein